MKLLLKRISLFFVFVPFLLLVAEVWLKYPSNHGGSAYEYANIAFFSIFVNVVYMIFSRRLAICRVLAFACFFALLYACDRFNVLVHYDEWIARGMSDWGVLQK